MPDKYLDAHGQINTWRAALGKHNLDTEGALNLLSDAIRHCEQREQHYRVRTIEYTLAKAAYVAEAHRLVTEANESFSAWCEGKLTRQHAYRLIKVATSENPQAALLELRAKTLDSTRDSIERKTGTAPIPMGDPLARIKHAWRQLSSAQQAAFLAWVRETHEKRTAA